MRTAMLAALAASLAACAGAPSRDARYAGTTEPFASQAIYFVVTDRFVNGDPANDHRDQGGAHRSFDIPIEGPDGETDNIGYLGGDFRGILDNAAYIREMGFTAVWITPIVDNPDEAFTGGEPVRWGSFLTDRGKAGYHGYWGVNFHELDEHLPSPGLDFAGFTAAMRRQGLGVVLDVVANHGSPSYTMPVDQPKYGEIRDADGTLVADHQNLAPEDLDPAGNPLHAFFHAERDLAQLSNLDDTNPAVLDYLATAYLKWIGQGVAALRIDTIRHVPLPFWKRFSERIRAAHPGLFLFGEAFDHDAAKIAPYTHAANGAISVLDFPLKQALVSVFGREQRGFEALREPLYLEGGPYRNPYELVTFYDNHDMARLDASDAGFIDAHNWLFTARGIPVVYYGSETGFMRGRAEHQGNRNYFGQARVDAARAHPIRVALARIATLRAATPALQRGVQVEVELAGDRAAFYRVLQDGDTAQIALVLLNKGDAPADFEVRKYLEAGRWTPALGGPAVDVAHGGTLRATVAPHDVAVWLFDGPVTRGDFSARLRAQADSHRRSGG